MKFSNYLRVKAIDFARNTDQYHYYKNYLDNQYKYNTNEIISYQYEKFNYIFSYHSKYNATYKNFLISKNYDFNQPFDISNIPIINKSFFRDNINTHSISKNIHLTKYSGGSTGSPLAVNLSRESLNNFWPAIWRAFDVYGIQPCDKVMMIAGPSLYNNRTYKRRIYDLISNFTVISAFDLNESTLFRAYKLIKEKNIKSIYGYTSSVLIFLSFLEKNNFKLDLKCIFTTSETFIPKVRELALNYCNCDVIDTYGANDGGVAGFECQYHSGYHLNFERCLVEIVDNKIVCTDLLNTASPFIRYEVGDYTSSDELITEKCECGRSLFRLKSISGRINEFIDDLDGNKVHSEFFSHIFSTDSSINRYQVIQNMDGLVINIHCNEVNLHTYLINTYSPLIKKRFKLSFRIVFNDDIITLANGKAPILVRQ